MLELYNLYKLHCCVKKDNRKQRVHGLALRAHHPGTPSSICNPIAKVARQLLRHWQIYIISGCLDIGGTHSNDMRLAEGHSEASSRVARRRFIGGSESQEIAFYPITIHMFVRPFP